MSTPLATAWQEIGNLKGDQGTPGAPGDPGADGVSITGATVNGSGDLVLHLSNGTDVTAGHVQGEAAPILDPQTSVQSVADLPDTPALLSAYLVRDDGHWYIYEGDAGADDGKPGYTDIGKIRGADGATGADGAPGADGADGVSVTGAHIDGAGHLFLTLSAGGPIDVGVARGAPGADGAEGAPGADGERGTDVLAYPAGAVPDPTQYRVGTIAIGGDGKLLRATA